ncbi:hypothetical protein CspeluHIS016_0600680 [Cutaneotrichosporon spelunceum]|uniref:Uncharacterized protein n=1 Tax=Cutaneotrichosporon spelunceum TaxID=1672016 RepID=A0AAD3YD12_9TREE|nr:hypothetical protein CspeluHIS016_0600680 [Cutaneotrichosporon spelunceum]
MTWEAVLDPHTFPRATLLSSSRIVGYLFPLPLTDDSGTYPITLDAPPATLSEANDIAAACGHHLAELTHNVREVLTDVLSGRADALTRPLPPAPDGLLRQSMAAPRPGTVAAWAEMLGTARLDNHTVHSARSTHSDHNNTAHDNADNHTLTVRDFTFPLAPAWARVGVAIGRQVTLVVPHEMPAGAMAWAQVMRIALEVIGRGEGDEGDEGEWDVAGALKPPMEDPVRITQPRGAEVRILPSHFEEHKPKKKPSLFGRFRKAL